MRFMILLKSNQNIEAGEKPGEDHFAEIRQVFEADDFGREFSPELREREARPRSRTDIARS